MCIVEDGPRADAVQGIGDLIDIFEDVCLTVKTSIECAVCLSCLDSNHTVVAYDLPAYCKLSHLSTWCFFTNSTPE